MQTHSARPKQYLASTHRALAYVESIEWETMPSLLEELALPPRGPHHSSARAARTEMVAQALHKAWFGDAAAWDATRPADLDDLPVSAPVNPPIDGLDVREVRDADTFLRYFATSVARTPLSSSGDA